MERVARFVSIGVDLGQRVDHSAIALVEAVERPTGRRIITRHHPDGSRTEEDELWTVFAARDLARLPLGTEWHQVGERVSDAIDQLRRMGIHTTIPVVVDATGIGNAVLEQSIAPALKDRVGVRITAATFTYGDRYRGHRGAREVSVGKAFLVGHLKALFQTGRIELPRQHREAATMVQELLDYEIRVSEDANERYGAFSVGSHDDLVTALGLSVLEDPRGGQVTSIPNALGRSHATLR